MRLKNIFFLLLLTATTVTFAQNKIGYSLYNYSLNLVNPAFAGQEKATELLINSRMQWSGLPDAPKTNTFSLNVPLKNNLGLGINVINDKIFVFNQTQIALDVSYKLPLSDENNLLFGIKAKGNIYTGAINTVTVETDGDNFFAEAVNSFSPNFSVGSAIVNDSYFAHLSINTLLIDNRYESKNNSKNTNRLNLSFGGGYSFPLTNDLSLTPSTLVTIVQGAPMAFDVNTTLEIKEKHNVGLSYSWNNSVQINGLASVTNWFKVGYGYSLYTNELSSYQNGTHEFLAIFNLDDIL